MRTDELAYTDSDVEFLEAMQITLEEQPVKRHPVLGAFIAIAAGSGLWTLLIWAVIVAYHWYQ